MTKPYLSSHCGRCKRDRPAQDFTPYRLKVGGWCRECSSEHNRQRYAEKAEQIKAAVRKRRREHPEKVRAGDRSKYQRNRKKIIARMAKTHRVWRRNNPEKAAAHRAVLWAVKTGDLKRKRFCERCGAGGRIEAHHADYAKKLDVEWLCAGCHRREHSEYD